MEDVGQSYSQSENNEVSSANAHIFRVTRPNMILQLLLYLLVVPVESYVLYKWHIPAGILIVGMTICFVAIGEVMRQNFKWTKSIELHNDKLIIIQCKKSFVVGFSDIKRYTNVFYGAGTGFGGHMLVIRLYSGKKTKILADNQDMVRLISNFDAAILEFNQNNFLKIEKYDADEEFAKYATPVIIIGGALIIIISILILLWRNGLRPDYS